MDFPQKLKVEGSSLASSHGMKISENRISNRYWHVHIYGEYSLMCTNLDDIRIDGISQSQRVVLFSLYKVPRTLDS